MTETVDKGDGDSVEVLETTESKVKSPNAGEMEDEDDSSNFDPDPQDAGQDSYVSGDCNKFHGSQLAKVMGKHLERHETSKNKSPSVDDSSSREEHNRLQLEFWQDLRDVVAADETIPKALFDPPRTYLQVRFAAWPREEHFCCPCDLDEDLLEYVEIRILKGSESGITKDILLESIGKALYGGKDGSGWTIGDKDSRPVLESLSWMTNDGGLLGHIFAMTKGLVEMKSRVYDSGVSRVEQV